MKPLFSDTQKLLSFLALVLAQGVVVSEVLAAEDEREIGIPYEVVLPDALIHDAFPDETFGDSYDQVKVDRVSDAEVDESFYPVIKADQYSGGTEDPETVYREMGDRYDGEMMTVIEPAADPANALYEVSVVAFDGYSGREVTLTYASQVTRANISTEERIYMLISRPEAIDNERRRIQKIQRQNDRFDKSRQKKRVSLPTSSPVEIINAN